MDGDKSIKDKEAKDIIAKVETCAYARGRSLIIFVGKMLRLGVSLPCVDIALHFDPITSVDIIYQSIFRVLTERDDKKKGFLIDLNKERFINFMYEMNNYETKTMKRQDLESKKQKMISKLFLYNLNGINTYFDESEKHANLYNLLAKSLSVDNDERFSEKLIQETSFKNFQEIANADLIKPLYKELKKLGLIFGKATGAKIKKNLYDRKENKQNEGKEGKENTQENSENNDQNNEENRKDNSRNNQNNSRNNQNETERDESDFEKNKNDIIKNIYNWVISLFAIHILFDEEISKNSNSNNAFDNSCGKKNIEIFLKTFEKKITSAQIEKICEEEKYVLDCHISKHLNIILKWDELKAAQQKEWVGQEELNEKNIEILETYKNLFKKYIYDKLGEIEKQTLINIYCNIKDNFVMLTDNISRQSGIIKNECSESLFSEKQQGGGKEKQSVILNENVLSLIRKYLTVREDEKKLYGEVFTPVELVCEMLATLPSKVWSDPTLKWLDPANGIGNYPIVAYYKLMEGLKGVKGYENKTVRSKHIIEKMLFMVELNPVNVRVCKKIFKMIDKDATPNIIQADFLENKWENKWGNNHKGLSIFDVIMGNPPYQKQKFGVSKGHANTKAIWPDFIEISLGYLKENGYLVLVHPSGWRDLKGQFKKIFDLIQERDLQHLTMRTFEDGAKTFGGSGTNFDYYCLKNTLTNKNKTKINDIDRNEYEIDLNTYLFIPSGKFDLFSKILGKINYVDIISGSTYHIQRPNVRNNRDNKFKFPVVYSITQKDGIKCKFTDEKKGMFVPKVIWSDGAGTYPIIDAKGDYGLTQFSYGIHDESKNLEYIKNAMNDQKFIDLMRYVQFGTAHKYNRKIISAFKKDFWKEFDYKNSHKSKTLKKSKNENKSKENKSTKTKKGKPNNDSPTSGPKAGRVETKKTKKRIISKKTKTKKGKTKKTKKIKKTKRKQSATQRKKTKKTKKKKYMLIKGIF